MQQLFLWLNILKASRGWWIDNWAIHFDPISYYSTRITIDPIKDAILVNNKNKTNNNIYNYYDDNVYYVDDTIGHASSCR